MRLGTIYGARAVHRLLFKGATDKVLYERNWNPYPVESKISLYRSKIADLIVYSGRLSGFGKPYGGGGWIEVV